MKVLIKIITFPIVLVVIILALLLRIILSLAGALICFMSESMGWVMKLLGSFMTLAAIVLSVFYIHGMVKGSLDFSTGILTMAIFWIVAFLLDSIWLVGFTIGEFLIDAGSSLTDMAIDLLTL